MFVFIPDAIRFVKSCSIRDGQFTLCTDQYTYGHCCAAIDWPLALTLVSLNFLFSLSFNLCSLILFLCLWLSCLCVCKPACLELPLEGWIKVFWIALNWVTSPINYFSILAALLQKLSSQIIVGGFRSNLCHPLMFFSFTGLRCILVSVSVIRLGWITSIHPQSAAEDV